LYTKDSHNAQPKPFDAAGIIVTMTGWQKCGKMLGGLEAEKQLVPLSSGDSCDGENGCRLEK
jgi:hypothetical protein